MDTRQSVCSFLYVLCSNMHCKIDHYYIIVVIKINYIKVEYYWSTPTCKSVDLCCVEARSSILSNWRSSASSIGVVDSVERMLLLRLNVAFDSRLHVIGAGYSQT